ncbi:MAG: LysR family transcriptional regulator [Microcystis aeruginosa BS13-10]|nr:LysR family transcriptional regulator [Microcystis aeruginosa BS13-10]
MARMTLDQLEIFLATAEHLHFTKAAEALYITQPAVSAAIASLESEYGVKLFHRVGRHIEITETGRLLQLEAQRILTQVALTERGLAEFNDLQRGELQLGSSLTIGNYWLPAKISDFQERYPAIKINCTLANTEEICLGTANGRFDLALIEGEVKSDLTHCLEQEIVGSDRLLIIVGRSHPWYKREAIELPELVETPWVMRESGSMVKAIIENSSAAAGISELMVQKELELGTLRSIRVIDTSGLSPRYLEFMRPFLKIKHRQRFQPRVCKVFEQML